MLKNITDSTGGSPTIYRELGREEVILQHESGSAVTLNFNSPAVSGGSIYLPIGAWLSLDGWKASSDIYMVCDSGESATVLVQL